MRHRNWRTALNDYLKSVDDHQFRPGVFDCSLFSASAVEAMTGNDFAAKYRGKYETIEQGIALLNADGYANHIEFLEGNFQRIAVINARAGDIAVVSQNGNHGIGIVIGSSIALVTPRGVGHLSLMRAERAYRID